jgi:hypothetical protein
MIQWSVAGIGLTVSLSLSFCKQTPPPVLFHSDAGSRAPLIEDATAPVVDGAIADAGPPQALLSNAVPGDGSSLTLDGVTLHANRGERFTRYVAIDADGDNDRDVVVLRARTDGSVAGLGFFRRDAAAFTPVNLPGGDTPSDPRCSDANVRSTSPRSVIVTYRCTANPATAAPADPAQAVAPPPFTAEHLVVSLAPTPGVRLRIAELPPLGATVMDVSVETGDRDADGRDDIVASVGARAANDRPESAARANVIWLDRPAGVARDTTEPEASFARLVAQARGQISRRGGSSNAIERLVRLRRVLCSDAGAARVRFGGETGVSCAGSAAFRNVPDVWARGLVAAGEIPAAIAATRPASAIEFGVASATRVAGELRRVLTAQTNVVTRRGPFAPASIATMPGPRASALTLEPPSAPTSIAVHADPASRIDLTSLALNPDPTVSSDAHVRSADGSRVLVGFFETCDGIVAAICPGANVECIAAPPRADTIPPAAERWRITDLIAADHAATCVREGPANAPTLRATQLRAIGFTVDGLVVEHRGRILRVAPQGASVTPVLASTPLGAFAPGSSASGSGRQLAVVGVDGLLVRDATGRWRQWSDPQLLGRYPQMTDLAVSDDGRTLVGLVGTQVWVLQHDVMQLAPPTITPGAPPASAPSPTAPATPTPTPAAPAPTAPSAPTEPTPATP